MPGWCVEIELRATTVIGPVQPGGTSIWRGNEPRLLARFGRGAENESVRAWSNSMRKYVLVLATTSLALSVHHRSAKFANAKLVKPCVQVVMMTARFGGMINRLASAFTVDEFVVGMFCVTKREALNGRAADHATLGLIRETR